MTPMTFIDSADHYQKLISARYSEFLEVYDTTVSEVEYKLKDLGFKNIPDLMLYEFQFLVEWDKGNLSSETVSIVLNAMMKTTSPTEFAKERISKKLINYMFKYEESADYIKPIVQILMEKAVPPYAIYISMLVDYFKKAAEFDKKQELIHWIKVDPDDKKITEYTFNQIIRHIDHYFLHVDGIKWWSIGDNIFCISEPIMVEGQEVDCLHFLFAPASYIARICKMYGATSYVELQKEKEYVSNLIKDYVS